MSITWFAPSEIQYTREQIDFILPNLADMREGIYPSEYRETGYAGGDRKTFHCPYTTCCDIAGEVDTRLAECWPDRDLAEAKGAGQSIDEIAAYIHADKEWVAQHIELTLSYISSGPVRRWMPKKRGEEIIRTACTYSEWMNKRRGQALRKVRRLMLSGAI